MASGDLKKTAILAVTMWKHRAGKARFCASSCAWVSNGLAVKVRCVGLRIGMVRRGRLVKVRFVGARLVLERFGRRGESRLGTLRYG